VLGIHDVEIGIQDVDIGIQDVGIGLQRDRYRSRLINPGGGTEGEFLSRG
jgi:hypothetical protein